MLRKIIKIDEAKCDGCGKCVPNCKESAIRITGGKARLVSEAYCDGLGACLGHCPRGAITIEERDAAEFDEKAVDAHLHGHIVNAGICHASALRRIDRQPVEGPAVESALANWPVQIHLVPAHAPFLKNADILIAADCVGFAYPQLHRMLLNGKILLVGGPKLDDVEVYREKFIQMAALNDIRSITYVHMEVPCCTGLIGIVKDAIRQSGKDIPFTDITVSIDGRRL